MNGEDIDPETVASVAADIELSFSILAEMRLLKTFTGGQIISHIMAATNYPAPFAAAYASHIMGPMVNKSLNVNPDGTFTYIEPVVPTIADHMNSFRSMLNTEAKPPSDSSGPTTKGH